MGFDMVVLRRIFIEELGQIYYELAYQCLNEGIIITLNNVQSAHRNFRLVNQIL